MCFIEGVEGAFQRSYAAGLFHQTLLVLVWFRKSEDKTILGAGSQYRGLRPTGT